MEIYALLSFYMIIMQISFTKGLTREEGKCSQSLWNNVGSVHAYYKRVDAGRVYQDEPSDQTRRASTCINKHNTYVIQPTWATRFISLSLCSMYLRRIFLSLRKIMFHVNSYATAHQEIFRRYNIALPQNPSTVVNILHCCWGEKSTFFRLQVFLSSSHVFHIVTTIFLHAQNSLENLCNVTNALRHLKFMVV